jgi:hypothetical protein
MIHNPIESNGGLRLGLTRSEIVLLLGNPKRDEGNKLTFEWHWRRPMTEQELRKEEQVLSPIPDPRWDVGEVIEVRLVNARVAEFDVQYSETY